jgi:2'-5' RNA ligase superfamily
VPVPAAEPVVAEHRARLDHSAQDGVPAHVTVLYPFLSPALLDDAVLASLARLFAGVPAFAFTLDRVAWFGDNVVFLRPADPAPFRALTDLAFAAFPSCPPYGGQHAEVIPHLTIGDRGGLAALAAAGAAVVPHLPVTTTAAEVILMAGPPWDDPSVSAGRWHRLVSFPLG